MRTAREQILEALVQVFTRSNSNSVSISVRDGLPIPAYEFTVSKDQFIGLVQTSDLGHLTIKSLLDLGSLYYKEIEEALNAEMSRRKNDDPDFGEQLTKELLPRLRMKDDPNWRYEA